MSETYKARTVNQAQDPRSRFNPEMLAALYTNMERTASPMNWEALARAAYEEHQRVLRGHLRHGPGMVVDWDDLNPETRTAWEATAIAVCDLYARAVAA